MDPRLVDLKEKMCMTYATLRKLEKELEIMQSTVEESCVHNKYIAKPDGDCHSPGYYYTCVNCSKWSKWRPNVNDADICF